MKKLTIYTIAIVILVAAGIYFLGKVGSSGGAYDEFAQCLSDNGAKMYGAYWCPHCQEQKKMFGRSWDKVNYIECSLPNAAGQNKVCNDAGIEGYPTWEFADGSRLSGVLGFEDLGNKTECGFRVSS